MSAPLRFLAVAVLGWAAFRAATLGILPGVEAFTLARAEPAPPPPAPLISFPPLEPVQPQYAQAGTWAVLPYGSPYGPYGPPPHRFAPVPVYYYPAALPAVSEPLPRRSSGYVPMEWAPGPVPQLDEWPLSRLASSSLSERRSPAPLPAPGKLIPQKHLDRLQLSAWAHLRGRPGATSLASGGTLGGSQAGARLTYALDPRIALSLRSYSPVGSSAGGEVSAGVRLMPLPSLPLAITAERRQSIGQFGGRSAFALFLEGGVYQQSLPWELSLNAYAQAGIVGASSRDLFTDGGMTVMRPLYGRFSAGLGVWGGAQPGLYRIDAGPRLSMRVRRGLRVDLDWRQRLAGDAEPGSGPAVTLSADF